MALATVIVTADQVKAHLNILTTASDTELAYFVGVASDLVEHSANRVWRDTDYDSEAHKGGTDSVVLLHSPVATVDALLDDGSEVAEDDYTIDLDTGLIRLTSGRFTRGEGKVVVSYTAGVDAGAVPDLAQHAVLETVPHLWATQRGTVVRNQIAGDDKSGQGSTYMLPLRVVELVDRLSLSAGIG